jgi:hypothetical protein
MIIGDLHFKGVSLIPSEADSPLIRFLCQMLSVDPALKIVIMLNNSA